MIRSKKVTLLGLVVIVIVLVVCSGTAVTEQERFAIIEMIDEGRCMPKCLECKNGPNTCTKCTEGADCCNLACAQCQNHLTCLKCKQDFELDPSTNVCVFQDSCQCQLCSDCDQNQDKCIDCIATYYLNTQMLTCEKCAPKCLICQNSYECVQCSPSTYWQDGACRPCIQNCIDCHVAGICDKCLDNFFTNQNGKCEKCMEKCKRCQSGKSCLECTQGHFFDDGINACVPCTRPCSTCKNQNQCDSCIQNFFFNETTKQCKQCNEIFMHCTLCTVVEKQDYSRKFLSKIQILSNLSLGEKVVCLQCDFRFFVSDQTCKPCIPNCINCKNDLTCALCSQSYFLNSTSQCEYCKVMHCMMCKNATVCQICESGFYWNSVSSTTGSCEKCGAGCSMCDDFGCRNCGSGFYLSNGNCFKCDTSCVRCTNQFNNCSSCLSGYFKSNLAYGTCTKCPEPCFQCTNITSCTHCLPGYYLQNSICKKCSIDYCNNCKLTEKNETGNITKFGQNVYVSEQILDSTLKCLRCNYGSFLSNNTCTKCLLNCQQCTNTSECLSCFRGFVMNKQGTACSPCPKHCDSCIYKGDKIFCNNCQGGFYVDPSETFCTPCSQNCWFCTNTNPQYCIDCVQGSYRKLLETSQICLKCKEPCKTCQEENQCLSCVVGYYLSKEDKCIKCGQGCEQCSSGGCFLCKSGYRLEFANMTCEKCKIDNCALCKANASLCDTCEDGYQYFNDNSSSSKISLVSVQDTVSLCYRCDQLMEGCKSCSQPYLCDECFNGLTLSDSKQQCKKVISYLMEWILVGIVALLIIILIGTVVIMKRKIKKTKGDTLTEQEEVNSQEKQRKKDRFSINHDPQFIDSSDLNKSMLSSSFSSVSIN